MSDRVCSDWPENEVTPTMPGREKVHGHPKSISKKTEVGIKTAAEADRALSLARTVGKRLRHELKSNGGKLPDGEWLQTAKWYERTIVELGRYANSEDVTDAANIRQSVGEKLDSLTYGDDGDDE